jgi:hypothetical protein
MNMDRYLIVSPHSKEECVKALRQIESIGSISHFEFGCKDGEHCGWVILEAENKQEALLAVPSVERHKAKAIRLVRFSPDDVKKMHG